MIGQDNDILYVETEDGKIRKFTTSDFPDEQGHIDLGSKIIRYWVVSDGQILWCKEP